MKVIARSSSFRYKGKEVDPSEAAKALGVGAVVRGRMGRVGEQLQVSVELAGADGRPLWGGQYSTAPEDLARVQAEISHALAEVLTPRLTAGQRQQLIRPGTANSRAYQSLLRGRFYWNKGGAENWKKAIELYEQALQADPAYAHAYAELSGTHRLLAVAEGPGVGEHWRKAEEMALKALELDSANAEAHAALARLKFDVWDWPGAEREFKRAIELNPDYAPAHYWYSNLLAAMRRFDESIREAEVAKSLDPYAPVSHMNYGRALYYARRYDEAAAYLAESAERYPVYPQLPHMLAITLMQQGRNDEAIARLEAMRPKHSRYADAALGFAYGRTGRPDKAEEMLRDIERLSTPEEPMPPMEWALVYTGMGHRDEAFAKLEEVYRGRFSHLAYLLTDPIFDGLRDDPRFADLARRVNLTP
jgi:tetratricopeptide (TPR) repeat protein